MPITENVQSEAIGIYWRYPTSNLLSIVGVTTVKFLMTLLIGNGSVIWYNLYEVGNSAIALKTINAHTLILQFFQRSFIALINFHM